MQPVYHVLPDAGTRARFIVELIINMLICYTEIYILLRDTHADCYKLVYFVRFN